MTGIGLAVPPAAQAATYSGSSDPSVSFTVPDEVTVGDGITISGTGWKNTAGDAGSIIAVKLDGGGVSTTGDVTHPVTGVVQANKTIWAIAQAGPDGSFSTTVPFPTAENSNATWVAGQTHGVTLLTGSLLVGDKMRSEAANFTLVAPAPAETAPIVAAQPAGVTVDPGQDAVFTAAASGQPEPTVAWESKVGAGEWTPVDGATGTTLTVPAVTLGQTGTQYRAVFTNTAGEATTDAATLTVNPPAGEYAPVITLQPVDGQVVARNQAVTLTAAATGNPTPTVEWKRFESAWVGEDVEATLGVGSTTLTDTQSFAGWYYYEAWFTNTVDGVEQTVKSNRVGVRWVNPSIELTFGPSFTDQIVAAGTDVTFEILGATTYPSTLDAPTFQWQVLVDDEGEWTDIDGATGLTLTVPAVTLAQSGSYYRVVASTPNPAGGVVTRSSGGALITVMKAEQEPVITVDTPATYPSAVGYQAILESAAYGNPTPTVQWYRNGEPIDGATSPTLTIDPVTAADHGASYFARWTNAHGSVDTTSTVFSVPNVTLDVVSVVPGTGLTVKVTGVGYTNVNGGIVMGVVDRTTGVGYISSSLVGPRILVGDFPTGWGEPNAPLSAEGDFTVQWTVPGNLFTAEHEYDVFAWKKNTEPFFGQSFRVAVPLTAEQVASLPYALPEIVSHPESTTVNAGQTAMFTAAASGDPAPTIQWQSKAPGAGTEWTNITGATSLLLTRPAVTAAMSGTQYRAVFANTAGATVTTNAATLTVVGGTVAPAITTQPADVSVDAGQDAVFTAAASGTPAPTVQWQVKAAGEGAEWANVTGATSTTLTVPAVAVLQTGTQYRAVFTNIAGDATTNTAVLTVTPGDGEAGAPVITTHPQDVTVQGGYITFEAEATGEPTPTVQWQSKLPGEDSVWADIDDGTSTRLIFEGVYGLVTGTQYRAVFTNTAGSATTDAATLTIVPEAQAWIVGSPVRLGGTVTLHGTGWFNRTFDGGSTIAIKIDDGVINAEGSGGIWTVITADDTGRIVHRDEDGNVIDGVTIRIPDGTRGPNGTTTPLKPGVHWLRMLTGSLGPNDPPRSGPVFFEVLGNAGQIQADLPYSVDVPREYASQSEMSYMLGVVPAITAAGPAAVYPGAVIQPIAAMAELDTAGAWNGGPKVVKMRYALTGLTMSVNGGTPLPIEDIVTDVYNVAPGQGTYEVRQNVPFTLPGFTVPADAVPGDYVTLTANDDARVVLDFLREGETEWITLELPANANTSGKNRTIAELEVSAAPTQVAPTVATQPVDVTAERGDRVLFTAAAAGVPQPSVRWESSTDGSAWSPIVGATTSRLVLKDVSAVQSGIRYRAVFTNTLGSVATDPATLTVDAPAGLTVITVAPEQFQKVPRFTTVALTAQATGTPAPTIVWKRFHNALSTEASETFGEGQTTVQLEHSDPLPYIDRSLKFYEAWFTQTIDGKEYVVKSDRVAVYWDYAGVSIHPQPASQSVEAGGSVTFSPRAWKNLTVQGAPTFQWQSRANAEAEWADIAGETERDLTLTDVRTVLTGSYYRVVVTSTVPEAASVTVTSDAATLTVTGTDPEPVGTAPSVTAQPVSTSVTAGQSAVFTAAASGDPTPTVQWQSKVGAGEWADVDGATGATLTVTGTTVGQSGTQFRAVFTNTAGSATTDAVTLTVTEPEPQPVAPSVTTQPASTSVTAGASAVFTAAASGDPTPSVQWQSKAGAGEWADIAGATSTTLTVTGTTVGQSGTQFRAVVTNTAGSATTDAVTLTVTEPAPVGTAPSVTTQPASTSVTAGATATFTAAATGDPTPSVQWQSKAGAGEWTDVVAGGTSTTLTVTNASLPQSGRQFRAVFTNTAGSATTNAVTLTVTEPEPQPVAPSVTTQPVSTSVTAGQSATFTAAASGDPTPTVQWQSKVGAGEWADITGATSTTFAVAGVTVGHSGTQFRAVFTNTAGSATTDAATLTVTPVVVPPTTGGGSSGDSSSTPTPTPTPTPSPTPSVTPEPTPTPSVSPTPLAPVFVAVGSNTNPLRPTPVVPGVVLVAESVADRLAEQNAGPARDTLRRALVVNTRVNRPVQPKVTGLPAGQQVTVFLVVDGQRVPLVALRTTRNGNLTLPALRFARPGIYNLGIEQADGTVAWVKLRARR